MDRRHAGLPFLWHTAAHANQDGRWCAMSDDLSCKRVDNILKYIAEVHIRVFMRRKPQFYMYKARFLPSTLLA